MRTRGRRAEAATSRATPLAAHSVRFCSSSDPGAACVSLARSEFMRRADCLGSAIPDTLASPAGTQVP